MNRASLHSTLSQLEQLLRDHRVRYAEVIEQLRRQIDTEAGAEVRDSVLREVRGLFGGMGSLNDVYISRQNGHVVDDEAAANHKLAALTQQLWQEVGTSEAEPER